jgi:hypothetical protein
MYRNPDIEPVILERMSHHTHVLIASAWFTNRRIREKAESMNARIAVSDKHENAPSHWHTVRKDEGAMMHYKFMVLGDASGWHEVIYGSYNFTENANRNDEFVKVSTDKGDIEEMVRAFEELYPAPKVRRLSLDHVVITQQLPWDWMWDMGEDLTETWEQHPIVSKLINTLFYYFGDFSIRNEMRSEESEEYYGSKVGGGVCLFRERCADGIFREILAVKDDNNGTTYTISNHTPPSSVSGEEPVHLCKEGAIMVIQVYVTKDDDGIQEFIWTGCGRGTANYSEELYVDADDSWEEKMFREAFNDEGNWREGMDVVTYLGRGYIDSIIELWAQDAYYWEWMRRGQIKWLTKEMASKEGQLDEYGEPYEPCIPTWMTFGWSTSSLTSEVPF